MAPFYLCSGYSKFGMVAHSYRITIKGDDAIRAIIEGKGSPGSLEDARKGVPPGTKTYDLLDWSVEGKVTIDPKTGLLRKRTVDQKFKLWKGWGTGMTVVRRVETTCSRSK